MIVELGLLVITAMNNHPKDTSVHDCGIGTMWNIFTSCSETETWFVAVGCFELFARTMENLWGLLQIHKQANGFYRSVATIVERKWPLDPTMNYD